MFENGNCLNIALFGTFGESKYFFGEFRDCFDIVGFNANMIAHAPEGIAAFISRLRKKAYFIDPQTHAFQQPVKTIMRKKDGKWILKKSIESLSDIYNSKIKDIAGKDSLSPSHLVDDDYENISKNILNFQKEFIQNNIHDDIKEFLGDLSIKPSFLIAPYFYLDADNFENEIEANIKFINNSFKILENNDLLFAEIVMSKEVLSNESFTLQIVDAYKNTKVNGIIIWIDNFSETDVSEYILKRYKFFLKEIGSQNKPILMLHGGFLSIVFSSPSVRLLAGVGHGIEYGESRAVIPVGGGVPTAKFYYPMFHTRINYDPDMQNMLLEMDWISSKRVFHDNVCNCKICSKLITSDRVADHFQIYGETKISEKNKKAYPTSRAFDLSRKHYLYNKVEEYSFCKRSTIDEIRTSVLESTDVAKNFKTLYPLPYLRRWLNII